MSRSAYNESYPEPDGRSGTHIPIKKNDEALEAARQDAHAAQEAKASVEEAKGKAEEAQKLAEDKHARGRETIQ